MNDDPVIRIHANDDVVIARRQLVGGTRIESEGVVVSGLVPPGHKLATRHIEAGAPVHRYDQVIGTATQPIAPGRPSTPTSPPPSRASCAQTAAWQRATTSAS